MEDQHVEPKQDLAIEGYLGFASSLPWRNRFWANASSEDPTFCGKPEGRTRTIRRPSPSHRSRRHPRRNPRAWSYTNTVYFDEETIRLLVGWAVRWIRGNGLPLGYRDPYATLPPDKRREI